MLNLFAVVGVTIFILTGLILVGLFMRWITDDNDFTMPWLVTCLFYAGTLAIFIVSNMS